VKRVKRRLDPFIGVDLEIVWKIIKDDFPSLLGAIKEIVRENSNENK